ncbi:prephenate dehydrogenase/arogenate dehydrogenase family protein [bacterium]|nr:prephenate dehydrogenase/arogenate dehydrogenase family protein [bacterium]
MTVTTIGIVGLGLIGGSIALRAKAVDPKIQVIAMSRNPDTCELAMARGVIDRVATQFNEFDGADIVFVCTPIPAVFDTLCALDDAMTRPAILTDVASLKGQLADDVSRRTWRHSVVLGHPMAGKETVGLESADSELLNGKTYILLDDTTVLSSVLRRWGCQVVSMTAADHDRWVGYASHLPYLAAVLAAGMAGAAVEDVALFAKIAASGFRDTTRVSASDPSWGADVLLGNSVVVLEGIGQARRLLDDIEAAIMSKDPSRLVAILEAIRDFRTQVILDQ